MGLNGQYELNLRGAKEHIKGPSERRGFDLGDLGCAAGAGIALGSSESGSVRVMIRDQSVEILT